MQILSGGDMQLAAKRRGRLMEVAATAGRTVYGGYINTSEKGNMLQLTKKHNKIQASYTLASTVHEHVKASNISV